MWYGRKRNVFPTWLFENHGPPFLICYLNVLCVPCQELVRLTCGSRPGNSVLNVTCPVIDPLQVGSNGHQGIHTGYLQDAERMRTGQSAYQRTSNVRPQDIFIRWRLFEVWNMFKTCQRIRPDKTDINWHGTHSPHEQRTRNAGKTDTIGQRIAISRCPSMSVTRPLVLSGKVWQGLNIWVWSFLTSQFVTYNPKQIVLSLTKTHIYHYIHVHS